LANIFKTTIEIEVGEFRYVSTTSGEVIFFSCSLLEDGEHRFSFDLGGKQKVRFDKAIEDLEKQGEVSLEDIKRIVKEIKESRDEDRRRA
jgi:uncharacterized protein YqfB (UPF0267 family)